MKESVAIIIVVFMILGMIFFVTAIVSAHAEIYPTCGIVYELDTEKNLVYVLDFIGEIWSFEGIEDWMIGDLCAMIMDDCGTETIYDDIILVTCYSGYMEVELWFSNIK